MLLVGEQMGRREKKKKKIENKTKANTSTW
jgi:hypothetical protein